MQKKENPDSETDPLKQNELLKGYLNGEWSNLNIVTIERMEKQNPPGPSGWRVLHK